VREPETTESGVGLSAAHPVEPPEAPPAENEFAVPWRWWDAVVVFVLAQVVVSLLAGFIAIRFGDELLFPTLAVATSVATIGLTLLWVRARYPGQTRRLFGPGRPSLADVGRGIGWGILAFLITNVALSWLIQVIVERVGGDLPPVQEELRAALDHAILGPIVMFSVIVFAPLGEELLFRGLLFTGLRRSLPLWAATAGSAIAFAVTHVEWLAVVVIFPVGLLLAYAFHRRGTLLVAVAAHATFNLINVVLLRVGMA
jgi:membrane protease YdiL (CAAX protease family)